MKKNRINFIIFICLLLLSSCDGYYNSKLDVNLISNQVKTIDTGYADFHMEHLEIYYQPGLWVVSIINNENNVFKTSSSDLNEALRITIAKFEAYNSAYKKIK